MSESADLNENEILTGNLDNSPISFAYPFAESARDRILNMGIGDVQRHILRALNAIREEMGEGVIVSQRNTPNGPAVTLTEEGHVEMLRRTNAWLDEDD